MDIDPQELWQSSKGVLFTYPVAAVAFVVNVVSPRDWSRAIGILAGGYLLVAGAWTAGENRTSQQQWTSEVEITGNPRPPRPDFEAGQRDGTLEAAIGAVVMVLSAVRKPRG
jgi:hypothetical protein